ncbi:MAG: 2-C-methyl-D-erythritol 4-phosphate cytidylyltransferase [Lachnospiraceae bacterium]|nr:2-C-methyl-D-erythritol 4-phosphate cytidylyltransferase [Lachnospiraceae bacterium]
MEEKRKRCGAVVLAAGAGKRMNSDTKKQFLLIEDKPVIYYSLKVFQESFIDEIVLVVSREDIDYCKKEIADKYQFSKIKYITEGGRERYHSVAAGIKCLTDCDYVFIHDGARPMITDEILCRAYEGVRESNACVVGMPVKDTIKIVDQKGYVIQTPDRNRTWMIQTPQVFSYPLIRKAYDKLLKEEERLKEQKINITDDAMVVEVLMKHPVKLIEGSYENIKITTPDDLITVEKFKSRKPV